MKLILFDFDGVLVNTNELSYQIHKIKNKDLTWQTFQGYLTGNFFEKMREAVKGGKHIPPDDYYGEYNKGLNNISGINPLKTKCNSNYYKYIALLDNSIDKDKLKNELKKKNINLSGEVYNFDPLSNSFKLKNTTDNLEKTIYINKYGSVSIL